MPEPTHNPVAVDAMVGDRLAGLAAEVRAGTRTIPASDDGKEPDHGQ
jgi:hypothetical protein